ncbi:HAD-IA family hydrolase [candidate division KSB1 bacterium]|nr:HAD-IA family hydrolase [candidate division KSB1 bacterium]
MIDIDDGVQALIFDCDGTLADNMPLHYRAWSKIFARYTIDFPESLFYELAGVPGELLVRQMAERSGVTVDPKHLVHEKIERYLQLMPETRPIRPVVEIVHSYHGKLPLAVATGGRRDIVEKTIEIIGLDGYFETIVTARDVAHPKPAPDTFLETARRLKIAAQACLVFEDGDLGLEGAHRAGMRAVDIRPWL